MKWFHTNHMHKRQTLKRTPWVEGHMWVSLLHDNKGLHRLIDEYHILQWPLVVFYCSSPGSLQMCAFSNTTLPLSSVTCPQPSLYKAPNNSKFHTMSLKELCFSTVWNTSLYSSLSAEVIKVDKVLCIISKLL